MKTVAITKVAAKEAIAEIKIETMLMETMAIVVKMVIAM